MSHTTLSFIATILITDVHAVPIYQLPALTVVNDCPMFCDQDIVDPLCGSDGRTYGNNIFYHMISIINTC